ncbi:hypothetical protein [Polluticaenibacter yanchengensis]|uniref:DUF4129 domain-containing protein n=1 Tax=Polluticaenibacter yanchengensis TaxID=3014562 RepID=A0ABT4UPX9_9BACT|nr:hypothetical protein [Chitinophagaceae bacterium LY-5]
MKRFPLRFVFFLSVLFTLNTSFAQEDSSDYPYEEEALWVGDVNTAFYETVKDTIGNLKKQDAYKYMSNAERIYKQMKEGTKAEEEQLDDAADKMDVAIDWGNVGWFKYILWALLMGLVVGILWNISFGHLGVFKRNKSIKTAGDIDVVYDDKNVDGYRKMINEARENGKNRLAVRYYFLYVLSLLNENGLIKLSKEKTNRQYLAELGEKELKPELKKLINIYDYVWFGEFEFDEPKFNAFFDSFDLFINKLKNNGL